MTNIAPPAATLDGVLRDVGKLRETVMEMRERLVRLEAKAEMTKEALDRNLADHERIIQDLRTLSWRVALITGGAVGAARYIADAISAMIGGH